MNGCEMVCPCPIGSGESLKAKRSSPGGTKRVARHLAQRRDQAWRQLVAADFRRRVAHVLLDGADHVFLHLHRDILREIDHRPMPDRHSCRLVRWFDAADSRHSAEDRLSGLKPDPR